MNTVATQRTWKRFHDLEDNEWVIRGKYEQVADYAPGELDVWVQTLHRAQRMEREGWKVKNHYDDGALFIRPFSDLDAACRYIKARKAQKPRHLTPEQRARAVANLHTARMRKATAYRAAQP